jgi:hypothetical protein
MGKTEQKTLVVTFIFKGTTINNKCALIMIRSGFLKRASSSGTGIDIAHTLKCQKNELIFLVLFFWQSVVHHNTLSLLVFRHYCQCHNHAYY